MGDRVESPENRSGGNRKRGDHEREPRPVPPFQGEPCHRPAAYRQQQEERVGGMNESESESCDGHRGERPHGRLPHGLEGQRERRDYEQLTGRRRRERERAVGAAVPWRERDQPNLRRRRGNPGPRRVEQHPSRLVRDERGERREDAGFVAHDERRVDAGQLGDPGEKPVPERERVAGVQAAVPELVHGVDPHVVERDQLAHPCQVEERVAVDGPREPPERDPEHRSAGEHEQRRETLT